MKLKYEKLLLNFACNFNLRHYAVAIDSGDDECEFFDSAVGIFSR